MNRRMIDKILSGEIPTHRIPVHMYKDLIEAGEERIVAEAIIEAGNTNHRHQRLLLLYANQFTDPLILFDLIIYVYTDDGYDFPKKLILLAKRLARSIPEDYRLEDLPEGNPVTVYRGCRVVDPDAKQYMRTEVSWTIDRTVAIWFADRFSIPNSPNGKGAVWQATIQRNKIIAFTQDRNESEVIQHMNVKDPRIMNISPEEWEAALKHREKERKLHLEKLLHSWD